MEILSVFCLLILRMWLKQKMISAVNRESTVNDLMWLVFMKQDIQCWEYSMLDDVEGNWHTENIQMKHWDSFTLDWLC